jgi:hypothetical protein
MGTAFGTMNYLTKRIKLTSSCIEEGVNLRLEKELNVSEYRVLPLYFEFTIFVCAPKLRNKIISCIVRIHCS